MLINVPQYIDVEDKLVGPLTAKQLLWFIAFGVIMLILWNLAPKPVAVIIGIPLFLLCAALAFYRPYGQPLGSFIVYGILYFFRPKVYVWKRTTERQMQIPKKIETQTVKTQEKKVTAQSLRDLAQLLDSEGSDYNEDVMKILKDRQIKKG